MQIVSSCPVFHPCEPPVLLIRATVNEFLSQSVLVSGISLTQMQDIALLLVQLYEVHVGPLLKLFQIPLDGIPFFCCANSIIQLGAICKLAEGPLIPLCVADEDIEGHLSQDRALRDTTHYLPPPGHRDIVPKPLTASIQPILYPLNSPFVKAMALQSTKIMVLSRTILKVLQKSRWIAFLYMFTL